MGIGIPLATADDDGPLKWYSDYSQAIAEAERTNRPIFLEFRCGP